jgi:hypothetical protein
MMAEVLRVIDAKPALVPEAVETLLASDDGVVPTIIKGAGAGSLAAFSELIVDVDALDPQADPMEGWSPAELDLVYDQIAFMAAQRDLLDHDVRRHHHGGRHQVGALRCCNQGDGAAVAVPEEPHRLVHPQGL